MGKLNPTQRISDVIKEIKSEKYLLPSIQRSFVWEQERICKLLDSVMSDYPFGSILVWMPPSGVSIRTRPFTQEHKSDERPITQSRRGTDAYLVLDGQQRLQSFFLAFYGTYDGAQVYFRLDSDPAKEQNDLRYQFDFFRPQQAPDPHWKPLAELLEIGVREKPKFLRQFDNDPPEVRTRVETNLDVFREQFSIKQLITVQEIPEHLDYNDVLEVFVRANSGGVVLTKSDLVFATVVLQSPDMEERFVNLVDLLNGGTNYEFDIDFLIKFSFVALGKGAKYDVEKLRDSAYIHDLEVRFDEIERSMKSLLEFLKTDAKIHSHRFLPSYLALIPVADFIFNKPHQQLSDGDHQPLIQYLYMSFFTRVFSHGADGRLDAIHTRLREQKAFPIQAVGNYITSATGIPFAYSTSMLRNLPLTLNITQGGVYELPVSRGWSLERDHIFPGHLLRPKGIERNVDDVGNLRLINKTRNILKSDNLPPVDLAFCGSDDSTVSAAYKTARLNLTQDNLSAFVQAREAVLGERVRAFLGF